MASILPAGKGWRAFVAKHGVRESKTFRLKAKAEAWATQREAEIMAGARGEILPHTLKQALEQYALTVSPTKRGARWEKIRLTKLARVMPFAGRRLDLVTPAEISAWRDEQLKTGKNGKPMAGASIRREMVLLRSVLEIARKEWGWLRVNPIDEVKKPPPGRPRSRRISAAEVDLVIGALGYERGAVAETTGQRVAVAFLWSLETAMRAGEVVSLTPKTVSATGRFARLPETKNGDARSVPLSKDAIALLSCLPENGDSIFGLSSQTIDITFRNARARTGIVDLHWHDLRHEAITRLAKKLSVLDLARMVGVRDPRTLMVYYNPTVAEIADQLD